MITKHFVTTDHMVMADSMNLITAQISFLDPTLALIHIPIELYPFCLQAILRLLFGDDHDEDAASIPWTNRHEFLNISITPVEVSVICSRYLADRYVRPVTEILNNLYAQVVNKEGSAKTQIQMSAEDYVVIKIDGQGLDAGQRVLELSGPLAMAGISIFFITTYFSDFILVPACSQLVVMKTLKQRGFVFSPSADAFVSELSPSSPNVSQNGPSFFPHHFRENSSPTTPPAKDIPELQIRTFTKLRRSNIRPLVDPTLLLANCAGSRESHRADEELLKNDLLQVLLSGVSTSQASGTDTGLGLGNLKLAGAQPDFAAKFLSVTITSDEPISILLEHRLLERLGGSLLGAKAAEDALIPITLDLRDLPLESTGIVCGVAGRVSQGASLDDGPPLTTSGDASSPVEISFLSTARAGTVIVRANQLTQAIDALEKGMEKASSLLAANGVS
jgi:hypothetical protein